MHGHFNLPEFGAHGVLESAVSLKPASQLRVPPGQLDGRDDLRVFRIGRSRPIKDENLFGLAEGHESFLLRVGGGGFERSTSSFNCAKPRAMRDLTVPKGTSRMPAISL